MNKEVKTQHKQNEKYKKIKRIKIHKKTIKKDKGMKRTIETE